MIKELNKENIFTDSEVELSCSYCGVMIFPEEAYIVRYLNALTHNSQKNHIIHSRPIAVDIKCQRCIDMIREC